MGFTREKSQHKYNWTGRRKGKKAWACKRWENKSSCSAPVLVLVHLQRRCRGNRDTAVRAAAMHTAVHGANSSQSQEAGRGSELFSDLAHHAAHLRAPLFRHTLGRSRHRNEEVVWNYYICLLDIFTLQGPPTSQNVFKLFPKLFSGIEAKLQIPFSQNARKISNFLNDYCYYRGVFFK